MNLSYNRWRNLFLFAAGLFVGTAVCMKWMEGNFEVYGKKFTILGLELFYDKRKLVNIFSGLDGHVKSLLRYHLYFDFVFMAGAYPGITALCMMAREKLVSIPLKKIIALIAWLQLLAWAFDCIENYYLLSWIGRPETCTGLWFFHLVVAAKWIIALAGVLLSVLLLVRHRKGLKNF
jgi:hypothetical protein